MICLYGIDKLFSPIKQLFNGEKQKTFISKIIKREENSIIPLNT